MNRRAKYDAASFILGGEIRNRTKAQKNKQELTSVGLTYIHTCRSYVHTPHDFKKRRIYSVSFTSAHLYGSVMFTYGWVWPARLPIRPILGFWGRKIHKNRRFPATLSVHLWVRLSHIFSNLETAHDAYSTRLTRGQHTTRPAYIFVRVLRRCTYLLV